MDGDAAALSGAFASVSLRQLVDGAVQQAQDELRQLCAALPSAGDVDR